jgi:hypothetical protein
MPTKPLISSINYELCEFKDNQDSHGSPFNVQLRQDVFSSSFTVDAKTAKSIIYKYRYYKLPRWHILLEDRLHSLAQRFPNFYTSCTSCPFNDVFLDLMPPFHSNKLKLTDLTQSAGNE